MYTYIYIYLYTYLYIYIDLYDIYNIYLYIYVYIYIYIHCVNSVQIWSYFWSVFSLNTEKQGPELTPYLGTFHTVYIYIYIYLPKILVFPSSICFNYYIFKSKESSGSIMDHLLLILLIMLSFQIHNKHKITTLNLFLLTIFPYKT